MLVSRSIAVYAKVEHYLLACFCSCVELLAKFEQYEPRCEKTGFLHMQKQRRRSASR